MVGTRREEEDTDHITVEKRTETITISESVHLNEFYYTKKHDNRPFVDVEVKGRHIQALLDTGANATVLGQNLMNSVHEWGTEIRESNMIISTANRTPHRVKGIIDVEYTFQGNRKTIPTVVVPADTYHLILGMDFIQAFGIDLVTKNPITRTCVLQIKPYIKTSHRCVRFTKYRPISYHNFIDETRRTLIEKVNRPPIPRNNSENCISSSMLNAF